MNADEVQKEGRAVWEQNYVENGVESAEEKRNESK